VLYLHRSARADHLADALGELLSEPLADPMAKEVVAVPTRGVERWLSQRLSHRLGASLQLAGTSSPPADGVCANIDWPFPAVLVAEATAVACGASPAEVASLAKRGGDPWTPERAVWHLLALVDKHLDDEVMAPFAAHLRAASPEREGQRPRRFNATRHLADLFERYAVQRPAMLLEWREGLPGAIGTEGPARDQDIAWQSELWRMLRQCLGPTSPAERLEVACARLASQPELLALPSRLSCFGLTRLPASYVRVLKAISVGRDVHLFLLHPSGALWDKIEARPCPSPGLARRDDTSARLPENPLLRSWGRDIREMQLVLASEGVGGGEHRADGDGTTTLLGRIQADIRADREPPGPPGPGAQDERPVLSEADDSVRVHSCHGKARQVEVVREAVLHLLASDPTLEPRDVIVMCPDIDVFAPLVSATFGPAGSAGAPALRARLADRSLRQTNPLLGVAAQLLELAGDRVTVTQVLDFASRDVVRRRFRFDEDSLAQIERWLVGTGVRWGLDGAHRAGWKLGGLEAATWRSGLDRLSLGVAMADDGQLFGGVLPFGDLSSSEVELAGRLAELTERLRVTLSELAGPHSAEGWAQVLAEGTAKLACTAPGETWQDEQLRRALGDLAEMAPPFRWGGPAAVGTATDDLAPADVVPNRPQLDLAEARAWLADRLRGRPTQANFRTGDMTICTLVPMRSVPHRVVCLLGLDDGAFPRASEQDGDDLLLARPLIGDRDIASEDRQLLLDALMAATEHLVITYEGRDQHLNRRRPPAVPVSELLDVVDRTVRLAAPAGVARPARQAVVVEHPLQPFDARNYRGGELGTRQPWRFDQLNLDGARALARERTTRQGFLTARLPRLEDHTVQLSSLVRFLEHPVRAFLRERLGFRAADLPEQLSDGIPLELGPLERWALGDRLLAARLVGTSLDRAIAAELGRGLVPPGSLGRAALGEVTATVDALAAEAATQLCSTLPSASVEVNVALPDGRSLVGTVPGVHGGTVLRCTFSKLAPKHRLRAWAQMLALGASHPGLVPSATTIGQAEGSTPPKPRLCTQTLAPLGRGSEALRSDCLRALVVLVDLFDRGMREPLPVYCATSAAWAQAVKAADNPFDKARRKWTSSFDERQGEASEPEHIVVLGGAVGFESLLADAPRDDELGEGWDTSQRARFGRLAMRLWEPLLDHEQLRER
jgi:exodeoxyribonuclease V gamma subunit